MQCPAGSAPPSKDRRHSQCECLNVQGAKLIDAVNFQIKCPHLNGWCSGGRCVLSGAEDLRTARQRQCLSREGSESTGQRHSLSHEGSRGTRQRRCRIREGSGNTGQRPTESGRTERIPRTSRCSSLAKQARRSVVRDGAGRNTYEEEWADRAARHKRPREETKAERTFADKTTPLPCAPAAFVVKALPLPCVFTAEHDRDESGRDSRRPVPVCRRADSLLRAPGSTPSAHQLIQNTPRWCVDFGPKKRGERREERGEERRERNTRRGKLIWVSGRCALARPRCRAGRGLPAGRAPSRICNGRRAQAVG